MLCITFAPLVFYVSNIMPMQQQCCFAVLEAFFLCTSSVVPLHHTFFLIFISFLYMMEWHNVLVMERRNVV